MDLEVKYRGKTATSHEVEFIKRLIAEYPEDSRRALSRRLCKAWNWVQPNGVLRDMVCRGYLLRLEKAGYIKLPPRRLIPNNPLVNRKKPLLVEVEQSLIDAPVSRLQPLQIRQVRYTEHERLFNGLIAQYHYLGYCHPVGEHLKYIVYFQDRPIACFAWSSAPRHIGCRDRYIGWAADVRKSNIHLIAYNSRFLIVPWVSSAFLASHLLSRIARVVQIDWQRLYHHPVYFLETFVDTERLRYLS